MQLTTTTNTIPLPAGALEADEWEVNPDGSVTRYSAAPTAVSV